VTPRQARQRRLLLGALAAAPVVLASRARADNPFPSRPVRIVVPYSVGIGPDVVARTVAEHLSRKWSQPVVVDNRPGASGIVAFTEVRTTTPDGHTLFVGDTATLAVNPLIHASLPYDPERDIVPITKLFHATLAIQVGHDSRFETLAALLAEARRSPGKVSYASFGNGHPMHVAVESMARAADVTLLHVPFRDSGSLMTAVANCDVDFTPLSMYTVAAMTKSGKMRALAVASRTRLRDYPQLPTVAEAGGPVVEMHPWAALVGVAGTPPAVIDALQRDVVAALRAPDVRSRIEGAGFDLAPLTPQALRALIAADSAEYAVLVREGRVQRV
jgi:tripartite-type tricarboxylate transporter receptor subunit TctC